MTTKPTIDGVSRELLVRVVKADASKGANAIQLCDGWNAMEELRAILNAPAVEDEAQATIAQLEADLTSAKADKEAYAQNAIGLRKEVEKLRLSIAELERGRGEPVAEVNYTGYEPSNHLDWLNGHSLQRLPDGAKLYTAPPAPVAVVQFANELIDGAFAGGSFDGGDIQDMAVMHGLLRIETREEECGEVCACHEYGFPAECYRKKGLPWPDVARLCNSTIYLVRKALGPGDHRYNSIKRREPKLLLSPYELERVKRMKAAGATWKELGRITNIDCGVLERYVKRH